MAALRPPLDQYSLLLIFLGLGKVGCSSVVSGLFQCYWVQTDKQIGEAEYKCIVLKSWPLLPPPTCPASSRS